MTNHQSIRRLTLALKDSPQFELKHLIRRLNLQMLHCLREDPTVSNQEISFQENFAKTVSNRDATAGVSHPRGQAVRMIQIKGLFSEEIPINREERAKCRAGKSQVPLDLEQIKRKRGKLMKTLSLILQNLSKGSTKSLRIS